MSNKEDIITMMSKPKIDSDGFQLVSSKNSSKKKSVVSHTDKKFHKNDSKIDIEKSYRYSKYFFLIIVFLFF